MKRTFLLRSCAIAGVAALGAGVSVVGSASPHATAATTDLDQSRIATFTFESEDDEVLDGAIITDDSGNGFDATVVGDGASHVDGQQGNALQFTGQQYLDLGTDTALQPDDISVSFWFKPEESMKDEQVFSWSKGQWDEPGWYLSSQDEDSLIFSVTDDDETTGEFYVTKDRDELFPADTWTHITVTYNTELRMASFYQNGTKSMKRRLVAVQIP